MREWERLIFEAGAPKECHEAFARLGLRRDDRQIGDEAAQIGTRHRNLTAPAREVKRAQQTKLHGSAGLIR